MKRRQPIATEQFTYTVILAEAEDGGYIVTCPALPGLMTEGDTIEEARAMAKDAIEGYIESLRELGEPIPAGERHDTPVIREEITVTLSRI